MDSPRVFSQKDKVENASGKSNSKLFPNPNGGMFTIISENHSKEISISIFDVLGKKIYETKVSEKKIDMQLEKVPAGIYIVKLSSVGYTENIKFIKQ